MKRKMFLTGLFVVFPFIIQAKEQKKSQRDPSSMERPPQFVLLAFDGSSSLDMWRDTVAFAKTVRTKNIHGEDTTAKFSYYINPVYYTEKSYKSAYKTPALGTSTSCIGWAAPAGSVETRVKLTDAAFLDGHEIGSHANSHCSADGKNTDPLKGKVWTEENWTDEFNQFNNLLFNALSINQIRTNYVMALKKENIVGFRAPALATTPGLWPTLKKFGFKYDTSLIEKPNYWPVKSSSWEGWNIPLAMIKIAGTTRNTLSMDYNWFVTQTAGESMTTPEKCKTSDYVNNKWCKAKIYMTPEKQLELKNQMLDSYKYYFKQNYFGGRAPVQIGHHFSKWNESAYWDAFKEFALFVCDKPEVRCVSINEYVDWLESLSSAELSNYRAGRFEKLQDDKTIKDISAVTLPLVQLRVFQETLSVYTSPKQERLIKSLNLKKQLSVDHVPVEGDKLILSDLKKHVQKGETAFVRASLVDRKGKEISWETYKVFNVGTAEQKIDSQSIESGATLPETADAHNTPD